MGQQINYGLFVNAKWGHIHVNKIWAPPRMYKGPGGVMYHGGDYYPERIEFQCDCGHIWEIEKSEFPGRRMLRSCDRVECPHNKLQITLPIDRTPNPGRPTLFPEGRGMNVQFYLPTQYVNAIGGYAEEEHLTRSAAVRRLLKFAFAGLADVLLD